MNEWTNSQIQLKKQKADIVFKNTFNEDLNLSYNPSEHKKKFKNIQAAAQALSASRVPNQYNLFDYSREHKTISDAK